MARDWTIMYRIDSLGQSKPLPELVQYNIRVVIVGGCSVSFGISYYLLKNTEVVFSK